MSFAVLTSQQGKRKVDKVIQAKLNKNGKQSKDKGLRAFQWYKLSSLEYLPASE